MATKKLTSTNNPDVKNWSVEALCLDPKAPGVPRKGNLQMPTKERSIKMPGSKAHAGMPIDANLAVRFIKNFYDNYQIRVVTTQKTQALVAANNIEGLNALHEKSRKLHEEVIKLTYGMTMEKDIALRILSQPRCEGLRFYLCSKDQVGDDVHLSLIAVGVDKDGYDLRYKLSNTIQPSVEVPGAKDVTTQSLTVEYVTPPYNGVTGTPILNGIAQPAIQQQFLDRFVLLKIANNSTPTAANATNTGSPKGPVGPTGSGNPTNPVTTTNTETATVGQI